LPHGEHIRLNPVSTCAHSIPSRINVEYHAISMLDIIGAAEPVGNTNFHDDAFDLPPDVEKFSQSCRVPILTASSAGGKSRSPPSSGRHP
jgi:hypothetical protein